jgi:thermitase
VRERDAVTAKQVTWANGRKSLLTNQFTFQLARGVDLTAFQKKFADVQAVPLPFDDPVYLGRLPSAWSGNDHPEFRLREMNESGLVTFAEPEFIELVSPRHFEKAATEVPEEQRAYMQRWQWGPTGLNLDAVEAWWTGRISGNSQTIGVIDLAFQLNHSDLATAVAKSVRITDYEVKAGGWGPDDPWGHGTFCAGLVGARRNGHGVVGVAPGAKLALAGLDALSQPRIATAIKHCLDSGARVISCSLGPCTSLDHGAGNCQSWTVLDSVLEIALRDAAQAADGKGACLFWATSNTGDVAGDLVAARKEIFPIGCLGPNGALGPGAKSTNVYLAPGRKLGSTWPREDGGSTYASHPDWATSYATPCAAGVAALLLEKDSTLSVGKVHEILRKSCRAVNGSMSYGAVDAAGALNWAPTA